MNRRTVLITIAVALGLAGAVGAALWLGRPLVTVTRIVEGPVVESFYATGTVQPITEYPIKTSNAGIITRIFVDKGDAVTTGQPVAVVEDPQLQFKLDKARAELRQAQLRADDKTSPVLAEYDARISANASMLDNAQRDLGRFTQMAKTGGASQTDLDKASDHVKDLWSGGQSLVAQRASAKIQLQTDLKIAEAAVAAAQREFDLQTLRSPIDGVVLDRPAPLGTRLNVNVNDHVMQIADVRPGNLVMRAAVDEENVAELHLDQRVHLTLYSFPGRAFEGTVRRIYDKADPDRRTFEVDVKLLPPAPPLAAGMTGELAFVVDSKDRALIAPAQALQAGAIYTVRHGRLTRVEPAQIGARSIERIEIVSGLNLGDTIVISPTLGLAEGTRVRTSETDPLVAANLNKPKAESTFKGFN